MMKKTALSFMAFLVLTACSSSPVRGPSGGYPNIDDIKENFHTTNYQVWSQLPDEDFIRDFNSYVRRVKMRSDESSKKTYETIMESDDNAFLSLDGVFYVCLRSKSLNYTICDQSDTAVTDCVIRGSETPAPNVLLQVYRTRGCLVGKRDVERLVRRK